MMGTENFLYFEDCWQL